MKINYFCSIENYTNVRAYFLGTHLALQLHRLKKLYCDFANINYLIKTKVHSGSVFKKKIIFHTISSKFKFLDRPTQKCNFVLSYEKYALEPIIHLQ
jgi:hypothetical protein